MRGPQSLTLPVGRVPSHDQILALEIRRSHVMSMMIQFGGAGKEWSLSPVTLVRPRRSRTKIEVLRARTEELRALVEAADHYLEGLANTPFGHECGGCGQMLATEYDFAAHFIVTDERHLNLGYCPTEGK